MFNKLVPVTKQAIPSTAEGLFRVLEQTDAQLFGYRKDGVHFLLVLTELNIILGNYGNDSVLEVWITRKQGGAEITRSHTLYFNDCLYVPAFENLREADKFKITLLNKTKAFEVIVYEQRIEKFIVATAGPAH